MVNKQPDISGAEWQIMRIVWTLGEVTSKQIIEIMKKKADWSDSTIKTLIARLTKKEFLERNRDTGTYLYSATVSELDTMDQQATVIFKNFCAHKVGKVLENVLENVELSKSDIQQIQSVLTDKLVSAPEEVECDCLPEGCHEE